MWAKRKGRVVGARRSARLGRGLHQVDLSPVKVAARQRCRRPRNGTPGLALPYLTLPYEGHGAWNMRGHATGLKRSSNACCLGV